MTDFFHIRYMTSSHDGGVQEQHFVLLRPQGARQGRVKRSNGQILPVIVSSPKPLDRFLPYSVYDLLTCWRRARATFRFAPTPGGEAGQGQEVKHCPLLYLLLNRLTDFFHIRFITSLHVGGMQEQHILSLRPQGRGRAGSRGQTLSIIVSPP